MIAATGALLDWFPDDIAADAEFVAEMLDVTGAGPGRCLVSATGSIQQSR
jgi:hypothetical protein